MLIETTTSQAVEKMERIAAATLSYRVEWKVFVSDNPPCLGWIVLGLNVPDASMSQIYHPDDLLRLSDSEIGLSLFDLARELGVRLFTQKR